MISECSLLGFPMTPKEIREIVFEYADENNSSGFSEGKEIGGYKWFYGFMKCHDKLRVKTVSPIYPLLVPLGPPSASSINGLTCTKVYLNNLT